MARTKDKQRPASRVAVDVGATGTKPASKGAVLILAVSVLAAIWAVAMMTVPGRVGYVWFFMYAEYYMGVITLVSLSITIMVGLVSTDRLVLTIRQRVLLQSVHRTTGVIAVAALFVHVWTKVAEKNIGLIDVFIPFLSVGNRVYVGMGTISGWILVLVLWTGIARSRFIGRGKPWMWRGIHAISYLMWPIALMHGLGAGRPAKAWVIVSYLVCVLGVLVGLAVRLSVSLNRRKDFSSAAGAGITPVGKLVPTSSPAAKRPSRREQERVAAESMAPVAVVDAFQPVAPPVAAPPPPLPMEEVPVARQRRGGMEDRFDEPTGMISRRDLGYETDERPRGRRRDEEIEYEEPAPRGRRYADDDTITWNRREMRELEAPRAARPEETGTRMRRPDMEDTGTRMRRSEMEDTGTWSRREMEDTGTRMRRPGPEDTGTRMRRPGPEDTGTRMRRSEMEDTGTWSRREMEDTGTRMRRVEMDYDAEGLPPRGRRYADDEPPPRSRRRAAAAEPMPIYDDAPRSRHGEYDEVPRQRNGRYADDEPPARRSAGRRESRYGGEAEDAPRARRDRGADEDRADSGRHSRSQFVDLADPADDRGYEAPDEIPALVDMASRRARREAQQDSGRGQAGRGARSGGRERGYDDAADEAYFSQLRGEAN